MGTYIQVFDLREDLKQELVMIAEDRENEHEKIEFA